MTWRLLEICLWNRFMLSRCHVTAYQYSPGGKILKISLRQWNCLQRKVTTATYLTKADFVTVLRRIWRSWLLYWRWESTSKLQYQILHMYTNCLLWSMYKLQGSSSHLAVADPGFPAGGAFRKFCMSKWKNLDPWGRAPGFNFELIEISF